MATNDYGASPIMACVHDRLIDPIRAAILDMLYGYTPHPTARNKTYWHRHNGRVFYQVNGVHLSHKMPCPSICPAQNFSN